MNKIAIIVSNLMRDYEIIIPLYIWKTAGFNVSLFSIEKKNSVLLESGYKLTCTNTLDKINLSQYNVIYIPGGAGVSSFSFEKWPVRKNTESIKKFVNTLNKAIIDDNKLLLLTDESSTILTSLKILLENPFMEHIKAENSTIQKCENIFFVKGYNAITPFSYNVAKYLSSNSKKDEGANVAILDTLLECVQKK